MLERSSEAAVTFPIDRPGQAQVAAKQNIGMIARLFVLNAKRIGILRGNATVIEEFSALIQFEACDDHGLRQPGIVSPIPEGIGEAHGMWKAKRGPYKLRAPPSP